MKLRKGDVVRVAAVLEPGPLSSYHRGNVFKLPKGYNYEIARWRVRCLFRAKSTAKGIVTGYGVRQVGIMTIHGGWGLDTYDKLESVSVVLVQPLHTQRWLKPLACLEKDLSLDSFMGASL